MGGRRGYRLLIRMRLESGVSGVDQQATYLNGCVPPSLGQRFESKLFCSRSVIIAQPQNADHGHVINTARWSVFSTAKQEECVAVRIGWYIDVRIMVLRFIRARWVVWPTIPDIATMATDKADDRMLACSTSISNTRLRIRVWCRNTSVRTRNVSTRV